MRLTSLTFKRFHIKKDIKQFHAWVSAPYASFWGMEGWPLEKVKAAYEDLLGDSHTECYWGMMDNRPVCLMETYDPLQSPLIDHMDLNHNDCGFHILLAPVSEPITGFSKHVFSECLSFLFYEKQVERIIVEPDVRNHKVHALNRLFGFHHSKRIQFDHKEAYLGICDKQAFQYAKLNQQQSHTQQTVDLTDHEGFQVINRHLVKKALTEFIHERILTPTRLSARGYEVKLDDKQESYHFNAELLALEHLLIDKASITRVNHKGDQLPLCITNFFLDFSDKLGLSGKRLGDYLEEINSTVYSLLYKYQHTLVSLELAGADFQTIEQAMIEGHPIFIANSGRIGFDTDDFLTYSPEAAAPLPLIWLAAHKARCEMAFSDKLDYDNLIEQELDIKEREAFSQSLYKQGLHPKDYCYIPVHPWQWQHKIQQLFTQDLVDQQLVYLGESQDKFQPQQSIRTFFNLSNANKRYIKVALSITNMGFVRGLSADYMAVTPAINDYVVNLLKGDPVINKLPFELLKEEAAFGYRQPDFNTPALKEAPFRKMLAGLFRENPLKKTPSHHKLQTMASFLQVDFEGNAYLAQLIMSSGLTIETWLDRYFSVYLTPLLQCFYRHKLVFMPHGENLILALDGNVPVKAYMKDIGEEVCLLNVDSTGLPEAVKRIAISLPEEQELLSIFTDVFDDFFRFMSVILYEHMGFNDQRFWQCVAEHIKSFEVMNPDLAQGFIKHNLFVDQFDHSCLNRLQLGNNKEMVDLTDPAASLQFAGKINNPIAPFK